MTLNDIYQDLCQHLSPADARYVLKKRAGITHAHLIAEPQRPVGEEALSFIRADLLAHIEGTPLSRLYGEREFWGLDFALSPDTLDPRPDTETLIEAVLQRYRDNAPKRILDLGTGTGCILIALLKEFPQATGVGVDLSQQALETARQNAQANGVAGRAEFIQSDWTDSIGESFDLVVSNPPYIRKDVIQNLDDSVKNHDPILALDGGEDGLQAYKKIFSGLFCILNPGGRAFFEIGFDQEKSIRRLSEESRFLVESTLADLAGHTRVLELRPDHASGDK